MNIRCRREGGWSLHSTHCSLTADLPGPSLVGERTPEFDFAKDTNRALCIGGVDGAISSDSATTQGVRVTREVFQSHDASAVGLRLILRNERTSAIRLDNVVLMQIGSTAAACVGGATVGDWRVTRMSRQKNDIPGAFRPARRDWDYRDADFQSGDVVAGMGVGADDGAKEGERPILADPCVIIRNDRDERRPGLFLGIFGQTEHLTTIHLLAKPDADELQRFDVTCEFDGVVLDPGECRATHWLLFWETPDERGALERFAKMLAIEHRVPEPASPPAAWCSWYFYGMNLTQADLDDDLDDLARRPAPIDAMIIDNGWMDTFGTWGANQLWPQGMRHAADRIKAAGFRPGIWTCPFIVMADSPILKKYPDLVLRDDDGQPCVFGYRGAPTWAVDPTAPSAAEYFRETYARLVDWGYTFHKFDFLRAVPNAHRPRFHDPKATRAQAYRRGMELIRKALGAECYLLACGGLFEAGIGLVDSQRSGCDVRADWKGANYAPERSNVLVSIKQNVMRSHYNRVWHTDPDALMVWRREEPFRGIEKYAHLSRGRLTDEEAFTLTVNQYLGGGMICVGGRFEELEDDRRALLKHVIPWSAPAARPLDYGAPDCPTLFLTRVTPSCAGLAPWWTLAVANWSEAAVRREVRLDAPDLPSNAVFAVFEFRTQRFLGLRKSAEPVALDLPPHGTRVLRLVRWDGARPVLLGTDLHLTGGARELADVRIGADRITGRVVTDWQCPVTVRAAFPASGSPRVAKATVTPGAVFSLS